MAATSIAGQQQSVQRITSLKICVPKPPSSPGSTSHPPVSPPQSSVWRSPASNELRSRRWKKASRKACLTKPIKGLAL